MVPIINNKNNLIWFINTLKSWCDKKNKFASKGRKAMELALEYMHSFPCGKADSIWLSYEPENEVAKKLYASFGFVE